MQSFSANVNNTIPGVAFNDIYLDANGNLAIVFDIQAVLQACAQAAQTLLGELIYNIDIGIPYFQTLWIGTPNIQQFNAALRAAFLAVPNVVQVVSLMTSQQNNALMYTAVIQTTYGSAPLTGVITNG
jgi:hypothetical protein